MASFDQNDASVVVIIGSGAGGGTLGNALAQKGINTVILEAGSRHEIADFVNDEWASFVQLAWTDMRTTSGSWRVARDFPNLPVMTQIALFRASNKLLSVKNEPESKFFVIDRLKGIYQQSANPY